MELHSPPYTVARKYLKKRDNPLQTAYSKNKSVAITSSETGELFDPCISVTFEKSIHALRSTLIQFFDTYVFIQVISYEKNPLC